jgi:hypothetical protein
MSLCRARAKRVKYHRHACARRVQALQRCAECGWTCTHLEPPDCCFMNGGVCYRLCVFSRLCTLVALFMVVILCAFVSMHASVCKCVPARAPVCESRFAPVWARVDGACPCLLFVGALCSEAACPFALTYTYISSLLFVVFMPGPICVRAGAGLPGALSGPRLRPQRWNAVSAAPL